MLAIGNGAVVAAFADFLVAIIFLVTALIAFIILTRTEFYRYYADESALTQNSDQVESGNKDLKKPEFFKLKDHGIYIFEKLKMYKQLITYQQPILDSYQFFPQL